MAKSEDNKRRALDDKYTDIDSGHDAQHDRGEFGRMEDFEEQHVADPQFKEQ